MGIECMNCRRPIYVLRGGQTFWEKDEWFHSDTGSRYCKDYMTAHPYNLKKVYSPRHLKEI